MWTAAIFFAWGFCTRNPWGVHILTLSEGPISCDLILNVKQLMDKLVILFSFARYIKFFFIFKLHFISTMFNIWNSCLRNVAVLMVSGFGHLGKLHGPWLVDKIQLCKWLVIFGETMVRSPFVLLWFKRIFLLCPDYKYMMTVEFCWIFP